VADDWPLVSAAFDPDPAIHAAYDLDYAPSSASIFGEWERLPTRGVYLAPGNYTVEFMLTEESFHGVDGELSGFWGHACRATAPFTIEAPRITAAVTPAYGGFADPAGTVEIPCGGRTSVAFNAYEYWSVTGVVINGSSVGPAGEWLFDGVTNHQRVTAFLAPELASNDVPKWWLAEQNPAWANDFDAATTNDADGDRVLTWQEHRAGTDPTDGNSVFVVAPEHLNGDTCLEWHSPRNDPALPPFRIDRSTNLLAGWELIDGHVPRSPDGTNTWCDPDPPGFGIPALYRVLAPNRSSAFVH
jgi:hypothetical protein